VSKLNIPDELRFLKAFRYAALSLIDFNNLELEDVLPGLFYLIRQGRQRGKGMFSALTPTQMAEQLAADTLRFPGFSSEQGVTLLESWLRASILRMASRGPRRSERVLSVRPLHFMSYRADLPVSWAHLRSVPEFVAALLHHEDDRSGDTLKPDQLFALGTSANLFYRTFGVGMSDTFALEMQHDRYIDEKPLDAESLLLVRLMERASPPLPIVVGKGEVRPFRSFCPSQAAQFRRDFSLLLRCYTPDAVPPRVLGENVMALLSLNLTTYFLSHCLSVNHLYDTGHFVSDRNTGDRRTWEPAIFADLTSGRDRKCRELARRSYQHHLQIMMRHLRAMIGLRLLDRALANQKHLSQIRDLKPGPAHAIERFEIFAQARSSKTETFNAVQAFAAMILSQLREHDPRNNEFLDSPALMPDTFTAFDQLVEALVISEPELAEHLLKFHASIARLGHHTSILARPTARRLDSYYTLTSGMLEMLVHLVPLREKRKPSGHSIDVYEFVSLLRTRYGIWIDKPPPDIDDGYEAYKAAQANMAALKEKLRQLGALRAVTDARGMQWIVPRYRSLDEADHTVEGSV
jgi:hypothetical protein